MLCHVKFYVGPTRAGRKKIEMVSLNMLKKLDFRVNVITRFINSPVIIFVLCEMI